MVLKLLYKCVIIFFIVKCCKSDVNQAGETITKLYNLIESAIQDELEKPENRITRRLLINDSLYQIHINKLKDVNGFKLHNIVINHTDTNSTIYINNPLEAKLPHPFMTLEEFKKALIEQRVQDREEFLRSKKKAEDSKKWADIRAKLKLKRASSKQINIVTTSTRKTVNVGTTDKHLTHKAKKLPEQNRTEQRASITQMNVITTSMMKTENVITNNKSVSQKTDRKDENKPAIAPNQVFIRSQEITKGNINMSTSEHKANNLSSSTRSMKGDSKIDAVKLSNTSPRMKLLGLDVPAINKIVTYTYKIRNKNTNLNVETNLENKAIKSTSINTANLVEESTARISSLSINTKQNNKAPDQNNTTAFEEKFEIVNDNESTTIAEQNIAESEGEEQLITADDGKSSTVHEDDSTNGNEQGSNRIEKEFIHNDDEQLTAVEDNEAENINEQENGETPVVSNENEETTSETTTTTTTTTTSTTTTTTPSTTRERWSRPRVYLGPPTDSTDSR